MYFFCKIVLKILRCFRLQRLLNDNVYLYMQFLVLTKRKLNLKNPQTFNEKLQWLKLYDRKDIYTIMVDKIEVKDYVSKIIGKDYIIPTLGIFDNFDEIYFGNLPSSFIIKTSHDSGGVVICNSKDNLDIKAASKVINKSLKNNYYLSNREWPYKNVKPRILIEKNMGRNLNDYKIFCFNGEPKFTLVCSNRDGNNKNTDFYDNDWNLLPFTRETHNNSKTGIEKPAKFKDMLRIAKKLSSGIPFIRVDLYLIEGRIYFGELTFFPSAGFEGFNPPEWDKKIGQMLILPEKSDTSEK